MNHITPTDRGPQCQANDGYGPYKDLVILGDIDGSFDHPQFYVKCRKPGVGQTEAGTWLCREHYDEYYNSKE